MSLSNQVKNQHLLWRAGFGPAVEQLGDLSKYTPKQFYKSLEKASEKPPTYINVADTYLQDLYANMDDGKRKQVKDLTADERKMIQQKNRDGVRNLNIYWFHEMVNSSAQLREKMAFFWHGHFACRNLNIFFQQGLLEVIRKNALGSFKTLLKEVSKTPAMLNFLNNQQNKKDHPNENFAREVMELFTLGRGNYNEHDVKEAARAFTGWSSTPKGEFIFRKFQHDDDSKTVLGQTGNFDGDQVLDILLKQKQTAVYVTQKLYKFLVNEQVDNEKINWLAERFYKNDYSISSLLDDIFNSDWFYDEKNVGAKIKSPIELLAGMQRILPMKVEREEALLLLQRSLGQVLFYPPNVAGWPGGKSWIDSSSLMIRMRIPQMLDDKDEFNIKLKDDDDQMMGRMDMKDEPNVGGKKAMDKMNKAIQVDIKWDEYVKNYESVPREALLTTISGVLLQTKTRVQPDLINKFSDQTARDKFIRTATLQIMSTPEYQLC